MDKLKVIYDTVGHTLTVWLDDPSQEHMCEETNDEVVVMKDINNRVIGFEVLHVGPAPLRTISKSRRSCSRRRSRITPRSIEWRGWLDSNQRPAD